MPITEALIRNAFLHGSEVALTEINPAIREEHGVTWSEFDLVEPNPAKRYRREITWREFNEQSNRFAHLLLDSGIGRGNKVALLLMNCLEWLPLYFGVLKTGAVVVPLNYRYTADEIKYCLELSDADVLVFGPEFTSRMAEIADAIPRVRDRYFLGEVGECPTFARHLGSHLVHFAAEDPCIELSDDDEAAIYFSSGTTGFPKAILHNHESLVCAAETEQHHHGQTRDDVFLCIPPLYHTGAKMHWFGSLLSCSRAVLLRGVRPDWIMRTVSEEGCTVVWLLVPWAQDILDALDRGDINMDEHRLAQWRLMHIGAQPVPPSLIKRWKAYFPNHLYDTNYGLSESTGPGCVHLGVENIEHVGAIGVPGYRWEAEVRDAADEPVKPGSGEVGELVVRGRGLMTCYYKDPVATEAVLKDGWLYTGDMAEIDADGFIYLVDRKKDVIISGGENLYPVQIEDFLRAHDAVKDVAVIGLPDERLGEIATAIIELKPDHAATEDDINEFCLGLPRYKRPRKIIFEDVPRNPTGKIEKPLLRERYGAVRLVGKESAR
ncbi:MULTISPECIES: class I adenylate-forming enzyme family protein [unclassified Adlercreutzia]|uniref:class I adenylate-forming enzyme family protein n=1 Tax=unclassified Adlercreutzia TaxID=2636013 RepID=UPI0013EC758B|nr:MULTISPECIES: AMP-binding protein [unclassified Adlercreutzia]